MGARLKSTLLALARLLAAPLALIPGRWRTGFIKGLIVVDSRIGGPANAMRRAFSISDLTDHVIAERATAYGDGEHPKHRLMCYHDFFVDNIPPGSRVIDVGCGYGAVARSIAGQVTDVQVIGMDLDEGRLNQAVASNDLPNLRFILGNVLTDLPKGKWGVVVMSNVLEHIDQRTEFLRSLTQRIQPTRVLIRVPLFERHWHMPMRQELGVNYFSDQTHFVEHTLQEFRDEIEAAGLEVVQCKIRWGEIWAVVMPRDAIEKESNAVE